jgi:glycosyltransferase involved in cell wall biosynthesis
LVVVDFQSLPAGSQNLWAHALTDSRFAAVEKHLLVPARGTTRLSHDAARASGIRVHEYGGRLALLAQSIAQKGGAKFDPVSRALRSIVPDLVWFNLAGIGEIGWIDQCTAWCRANGVPYWLIAQHVHEEFFFISDSHTAAALAVARGAARVLTVSNRNRDSLAAAFGERLPNVEHAVNGVSTAFLGNAARIAATAPRTAGTARFISPARFDPAYKGQHLLLEAVAGAEWRARDWHLTMIGGGPHSELVHRLVGFYGVPPERVTLAAHTSDMPGAFAESDVIVMPSLSEGSPFALAEGMACGRPAVGTPVGGIDELVRDGETGWLAHSTEPSDIAATLDRCWHDRALWPQFGRAARELASREYDLGPAHAVLLEKALADARAKQRPN